MTSMVDLAQDYNQEISDGLRHNLIVLSYGGGSIISKNDTTTDTPHSDNRTLFLRRKRQLLVDADMTLNYGPGGWCELCGQVDDYSCDRGIHNANWNGGVRTFQDPTACGAMYVKATVYGGDLGAVSLRVFLNDVLIGEQMWQGSPLCDTCTSAVFESAIRRSGSDGGGGGGYVVGGENKIQLVPVGDDDPDLLPAICIQRVELDLMDFMSCAPSGSPSHVPSVEPSLEPTIHPSSAPTSYPSSAPSTLSGRPLKLTFRASSSSMKQFLPSSSALLSPNSPDKLCLKTEKVQRNQHIVLGPCCTSALHTTDRYRHSKPVCNIKDLEKQIWFFDGNNQLRLHAYPDYCIRIKKGRKLILDNQCDGAGTTAVDAATSSIANKVYSTESSSSKSNKSHQRTTIAKFLVQESLSSDTLWIQNDHGATVVFRNRMFVCVKKPKSAKGSFSSRSKSRKGNKSNKSEKCKSSKDRKSSRSLKSSKSCKSTSESNMIKQRNNILKLYTYSDNGSMRDDVIGKGRWSFEFQSSSI